MQAEGIIPMKKEKSKEKQEREEKKSNAGPICRNYAYILLVILLAVAVLIFPAYTRVATGSFPLGYASYKSIIDANHLIQKPELFGVDGSLAGTRPFVFNSYAFALSLLTGAMGSRLPYILLPFLLGLLSSCLLFLILIECKIIRKKAMLISAYFIASPAFFYAFAASMPASMGIFLNLFGFLFLKKAGRYSLLGIAAFALVPFSGIMHFISALMGVAFLLWRQRGGRSYIWSAFIMLLIVEALLLVFGYLNFGLPSLGLSYSGNLLAYFISDLGSPGTGLGVFMVFLSFIGMAVSWRKKASYYPIYAAFLSFFLLSLMDYRIMPYLSVPAAFFASEATYAVLKRNWHLHYIRFYTILLIVCGVLFSTFSFSSAMLKEGPDEGEIRSLEWLGRYSESAKGSVFSHPRHGFMISVISGLPVVADSDIPFYYSNLERNNDVLSVLNSRNLAMASEIFGKYGVEYIWINSFMLEDFWEERDDGLLFLFRNNETFKKLYDNSGVEIWQLLTDDREDMQRRTGT